MVGLLLRAALGHSNYLGYTGNRINLPSVPCRVDNTVLAGLDGLYFRSGLSEVFGKIRVLYTVETTLPLPDTLIIYVFVCRSRLTSRLSKLPTEDIKVHFTGFSFRIYTAVSQAISRQPFTEDVWVRSRAILYGICGGNSDILAASSFRVI